MTFRKAVLVVLAALVSAFGLAGCGKGGVPVTVNPLAISTSSLPDAVVNKSYSATLAATGGATPYTWVITSGTLPSGISMTSSGTLSGTPTTSGAVNISVQVTDSQKPIPAVASTGLTLKVNDVLALTTTTLPNASVNIPYQQSLTATGGSTPYKWSITSGSLPAGLTLDPSYGVIYGTPTTQSTSNFTVQVADSESPPVTLTQPLTLTVGGAVSRLSGNYAFLFRGFKNGKLVLQAGSFVSDGNGLITGGVTDIMSTSSTSTGEAISGTYTLDDTGHGTMSLSFGPGGLGGSGSYQITGSVGGYWSLIENGDGQTTTYGAGILKKQSSIPTDLISSRGTWVFGGYGSDNSDGRYASVGKLFLSPSTTGGDSALSDGLLDTNDSGTVSSSVSFDGGMKLPDATTGRGTLYFTVNQATQNFAYYYIDSSDLILIGTDQVNSTSPLILLSMTEQTTALQINNAILNGNGIVELSTIGSSNGSSFADTSLGAFSLDANGNYWASIDENAGGTLSLTKPSGTYNVASTGRTTFTGWGSSSPVFYIASTDVGYIMGTDASVTYGEMEQQRPPNMNNATFINAYSGGTILNPVLPLQTVEVDTFTADGGKNSSVGNLTGTYDTSGPGGPMQGLKVTATYNVDSACTAAGTGFNTCGRFGLYDTNNKEIGIGYVTAAFSPNRTVIMTTDPQPVINALEQ